MKLFYWNGEPNFGDALAPLICERLFNVGWSFAKPSECDMVAVGSLLENFYAHGGLVNRVRAWASRKFGAPVIVWGTGFLFPPDRQVERMFARTLDVRAVRGCLTLNRLRTIMDIPDGVVLGDPGLLAPKLVSKKIPKRFHLGIVPHFVDYDAVKSVFGDSDSCHVIDVRKDPVSCIEEIASCDSLVSSSLHGLIVADAYGVPNARLRVSDRVVGGDFKFEDYCSVIGDRPTVDLKEFSLSGTSRLISSSYSVSQRVVESAVAGLESVFPFV